MFVFNVHVLCRKSSKILHKKIIMCWIHSGYEIILKIWIFTSLISVIEHYLPTFPFWDINIWGNNYWFSTYEIKYFITTFVKASAPSQLSVNTVSSVPTSRRVWWSSVSPDREVRFTNPISLKKKFIKIIFFNLKYECGLAPGQDCGFNLRAKTTGVTVWKRIKYIVLTGYFFRHKMYHKKIKQS